MTADFSSRLRASMAALLLPGCCMALAGEDPAAAGLPAVPAAAPAWQLSGYGTLGTVHSDESQADFTANVLNPGSAGHSRSWSADVDSRLGAQLDLRLDDAWSAVLQLLSERRLQSSYAPRIEWANIKYQATPDLSVRLGRIALPLFLAGDYRKAGYALPWVRPPVELYGAIPISNSDGVDASAGWSAFGVNQSTQVFLGRTDLRLGAGAHASARAMSGLSNTSMAGPLTVRVSAMTTELSVDVAQSLFDALRQFGAAGAALAERYDVAAKRASVVAAGFNYDVGAWFVMGEAGRVITHSYLGDQTSGYLSAGYRIGDLTPYLVYSAVRANSATSAAGLELAGMPPPLAAAGAQLNAGLNSLLGAIVRQRTLSAGLRWDAGDNYAFKLQYDRLAPQQGSSGSLINVQPGFRAGPAIGVISATIDFVF